MTLITVRTFQPDDLATLHDINQASTPGVSSESPGSLLNRINLSTALVAVDGHDRPVGFMTLIEPGTMAYGSENLRWFEAYCDRTGRSLIYVDRIAIAPERRGEAIGEQLYKAAFEAFATCDEIGCEINTNPPNPGSARFHERLGFRQVGEGAYGIKATEVAYYVRDLAPAAR